MLGKAEHGEAFGDIAFEPLAESWGGFGIALHQKTQFGIGCVHILGIPHGAQFRADNASDGIGRRVVDRVLREVELTALPGHAAEHGTSGGAKAGMVIGGDELDAPEAASDHVVEEGAPMDLGLGQGDRDPQQAPAAIRSLIWWFYSDLKTYRTEPCPRRRWELRARFDRIFRRTTGFAGLDRLLKRLHANKDELLMVLDRPEIPLNTNGSENDIRSQVTRRKISGGTRSDAGRDCRDAFLGLAKTCAKLRLSFWDYLGGRLGIDGSPIIPSLAAVVSSRCREA